MGGTEIGCLIHPEYSFNGISKFHPTLILLFQSNLAEVYRQTDFQVPTPVTINGGYFNSAQATSSEVTILNNRQLRVPGLRYTGNCGDSE